MKVCPACRKTYTPRGGEVPCPCPHCRSLALGPYRDLAYIGGGGMGDVYRARDPEMGNRTVAIKIPRTETEVSHVQRRFEREIAASGRLEHENVVRAYHRGQEEGRPYLVMEFVQGRKLSEIVQREHPLAPRRVARILQGVAKALAHAERKGVINRDLKPDNIFLAEPEEVPKLLDYGLALLPESQEQVTRYGSLLGTPSYVAPEQTVDPHSVTIAADVYSLGCTAYFCLTGHPPFIAADITELCRQHAKAPRPNVCDERPDAGRDLDVLIRQMMSPDPYARPSPERIVAELERILPQLSDRAPSLPRETTGELFDVKCPECGECFHLPRSSIGKSIRCGNKLCKKVFVAAPEAQTAEYVPTDRPAEDAATVLEASLPEEPRPARPASKRSDGDEVVEMLDAVAVPLEPLLAEPLPAEDAEAEILPMDALVDEEPPRPSGTETLAASGVTTPAADAPSSGGRQRKAERDRSGERSRERKRQRGRETVRESSAGRGGSQRRARRAKWIAGAVLVLLVGSSWLIYSSIDPKALGPDPDADWAEIMTDYEQHKWSRALRGLEKFEEKFPEDERIPQIPFFRDMCKAGGDIYSTTGNPETGLESVQEIFKSHRDNPAYKLYCVDIYMALDRLLERLVAQGESLADPQKLDRAAEAHDLMKTVGQQIKEPWVEKKTTRWDSLLARAELTVSTKRARTSAAEALELLIAGKGDLQPDEAYAKVDDWLKQHPGLRDDRELASLLDKAYRSEPSRIQYEREPSDAQMASDEVTDRDRRRQGTTLVVAWGGEGNTEAVEPDDLVYALARGILYVFDRAGSLRWARRLGVDSSHLPSRIRLGGASGEALIAVNSEDNLLLALDVLTGRVLWNYRVGGDVVAPLTLVARRPDPNLPERLYGLLPTAGGDIHVLELARGRRIGLYRVGQPMVVGGSYDPATDLVLFPADGKRVYAINPAAIDDPKAPGCVSILHTGHAAGALRAGPIVVGQYLILAEVSELEHTRLRVFELRDLGFSEPKSQPLKEVVLKGWFWFPPCATPDRITLVTDQGDLGVFGLNLDNIDEALYPIVQSSPQEAAVRLNVHDASRTMAVHTEEHLVWVMAGGRLQKFAVDLLRQKLQPLWPEQGVEGGIGGVPVHEPVIDAIGRTFFLTTMSPRGGVYRFASVDCDTGANDWQRQLGVSVLGDPVVMGDTVVLIDQGGGTVRLRPESTYADSDLPRIQQLPQSKGPPEGADETMLMRIGEPPGPIHLVLPIRGGSKVALRTVASEPRTENGWTVLSLPEPLHGRPCVAGDYLVAPCADGQIYRVKLDGTGMPKQNEVTFTWASVKPPGPNQGQLYSLGADTILLVDGQRVRRLVLGTQDSVTGWKEQGQGFYLPAPMQGQPLITGQGLLLFDATGTLFVLDPKNPNRELRRWSTGLKVTDGPFLRDGKLLAVVDHAKLACLDLEAAPDVKQPLWITAGFRGWIRGRPTLAGDVLLVADGSLNIMGVRLSDGSEAWKAPLGGRLAPSAAPVAYGKGRFLVPLADGTLVIREIPQPAQSEENKP